MTIDSRPLRSTVELKLRRFCCGLVAAALCACAPVLTAQPKTPPPNILLIVADDLGYSDIGALGSEIPTPHLDELAAAGMLLTNFHVLPGCSPTRAMLMSGTDNHLAGVGSLHELLADNQRGQPGYQGHLAREIVSLPTILQASGYRTYMTGKWHLGQTDELSPKTRGFHRSFAMLHGGASHFADQRGINPQASRALYREDGKLAEVPEDFYSTYFYTDRMIEYLEDDGDDQRPFFAYLAYTAPHWPLHAPEEWQARFRGHYSEGYEVIRARRVEKMRELGFAAASGDTAPRISLTPAWDQLSKEQQTEMARRMEVYAAMVAAMDDRIGRLVDFLKASGQFDNTLILMLSDNGPDFTLQDRSSRIASWVQQEFDNSLENMGRQGSFISYGPGWAQASAGPLRLFKGTTAQGGTLSPLMAVFPGRIEAGARSNAMGSAMDILPTLLAAAGIEYLAMLSDRSTQRLRGKSLMPVLTGVTQQTHTTDYVLGMELLDSRALHQGDWKLVNVFKPLGPGRWQLYNLAQDPGETRDLAAAEPDRLKHMIELYKAWADEVGVIEPAGGPPLTRAMLAKSKPASK